MSKIEQKKILVELMKADEASGMYEQLKWKLVRERDNKTKYGSSVAWIEWKENGMFGNLQSKPKIGLSCMLDPHPFNFTWLTTGITEIVEEKEDYIKFNTENSTYELWKQY